MAEATTDAREDYVGMAVEVVVAYVSKNPVQASELGSLIANIHGAISSLAAGGSVAPEGRGVGKPTAAQIRKSITHDGLISFEDGKPYKTLRRHLKIRGLTPEAYRAKYGLPTDYPMTSAGYSARRSELARAIGLGNRRKATPTES